MPALGVAIVFFTGASVLGAGQADADGLAALTQALQSNYAISLWLLLPFIALFAMAYARVPALVAILASVLIGAVFGVLLQGAGEAGLPGALKNYWAAAATGCSSPAC